jgi:hypothetical protein
MPNCDVTIITGMAPLFSFPVVTVSKALPSEMVSGTRASIRLRDTRKIRNGIAEMSTAVLAEANSKSLPQTVSNEPRAISSPARNGEIWLAELTIFVILGGRAQPRTATESSNITTAIMYIIAPALVRVTVYTRHGE